MFYLKAGEGSHVVVGEYGELIGEGLKVIYKVRNTDTVTGHLRGIGWTDT